MQNANRCPLSQNSKCVIGFPGTKTVSAITLRLFPWDNGEEGEGIRFVGAIDSPGTCACVCEEVEDDTRPITWEEELVLLDVAMAGFNLCLAI